MALTEISTTYMRLPEFNTMPLALIAARIAWRSAVRLLGVPFLRPRRRSPGLDPPRLGRKLCASLAPAFA